ncbi:hypothetical protein [Priestia aryabhattai]
MDINDLKNKQNKSTKAEEIINLFETFKQVSNRLSVLTSAKVRQKKLELNSEFENYFTQNGFEVTKTARGLKAVYQDVEVNLQDQNPDSDEIEGFVLLEIHSKKIHSPIVIKASEEDSYKLAWKNNLKNYHDRYIGFDNYQQEISKIDDDAFLGKLIRQINENIEWYNQTINDFESIDFVYSHYKGYKEYKSFEEYFKAL